MAEFVYQSQSEQEFERALVDAYERASIRLGEIIRQEVERSTSGRPGARQAALLRQIDRILSELGVERDAVLEALGRVYIDSSARAVDVIRRQTGINREDLDVSFGLVDQEAITAVARIGASALDAATVQIRAKAARLVQSTQLFDLDREIRQIVGSGLAQGETRRDISKRLAGLISGNLRGQSLSQLIGADALVILEDTIGAQMIEVGGWRGTIKSYASLVGRTMMRDASTQATVNRTIANGLEVLEVSRTLSSEDACVVFEGLLVSATGKDPRFPHVNQLPNSGTPFHPNCTHVLAPRSLEVLTDDEIKRKTRIKKRYLGKTWRELERIRKKEFGGNHAAMRRDARR